MSLLMDALKRAEEAKRQGAQPGEAGFTLEPRADDKSPLPDLSSHLDAVNADLQAEAAQRAPASKAKAPERLELSVEPTTPDDREIARQAFAAKTTARAPRSNIPVLIGIGSLLGLAVSGYFGYQYMVVAESANRLVPTGPVARAPAARPAPITVTPTPAAGGSTTSATITIEPTVAAPAPKPAAKPAPVRRRVERPAAAPAPADQPQAPSRPIAVTNRPSTLEEALATGYQAINRGEFDRAAVAYQAALREDPNQIDAWLGMGAVAVARRDADAAASAYLRVLEIDPRNATAHVGLLGLGASGDLTQRESRLRSLLASHPPGSHQAGMLQFGLGNLYAMQRRWSDAQQAFFAAHASDAGNPDYLYNLAVSLDHLQQKSLALKHYQAARAAVGARPGAFDSRQIDARIEELSR